MKQEKIYKKNHFYIATTYYWLGKVNYELGSSESAIELFEKSIDVYNNL